jgi:MFS family permease
MAFKIRPYHQYMLGMLFDRLGFQIQSVAVGWHVFSLRHSPFDLGMIGLALFLPNLLFFIPAGVVADRFPRQFVWCVCELVEALGVGVLIAFVLNQVDALWPYLLVLFFIGTCWAVSAPSSRSMLPNLVPRESFVATQAQYASLRSIAIFAGPALGGVLVAVGVVDAFCFTICTLLLSACTIASLKIPRKDVSGRTRPGFRESLDGFAFIRSQPLIAAAMSLDLLAVLFGGATALLPAFASTIFHAGPIGLGLLRCAPSAGAAVMAALLSGRPPRHNVGRTLIIAIAVFGIATIIFGLSKNFWLSMVALAVTGGADMFSVVIRNALVQLTTPDHMRGRVSAFENIFIGASNELGEFESGTVAAWIGIVPAVVVGGVATLAVIAIWSRIFPALRNAPDLEKFAFESQAQNAPG